MFLKNIEIRGFKSFADAINLSFNKGVTGIVGPNGSGKSNISDAVRWVLGEQSAKTLRGSKMEDVIFAGTQFRKPVSLAQVSITFDNSDGSLPIEYSDVTISRRLYRSGESEYRINRNQCRLKDIQELLMDTGIGKEGYSIIGQGKIDTILNGRPEDRREILEEAAGVVKYKYRKEESEKKLDNTEQNLVRINDILSTYEERIGPLKIEKEKAEKFLELSNDLKSKEINLLVHSILDVKSRQDSVTEKLNAQRDKVQGIEKEKNDLKKSITDVSEKLERNISKNNENKKQYYDLKSDIQNINSENKILNERISNFTKNTEKQYKDEDNLEEKISSLIKQKSFIKSEEESLKKQSELSENDISDSLKKISEMDRTLNESENRLAEFSEKQTKLQNEILNIKNNISILMSNSENKNERLLKLKDMCKNYEGSIKLNSNTKDLFQKEISGIKEKVEEKETELKSKKYETDRIKRILNSDEGKLKILSAEFNRTEANVQMLKSLENQYEGYNRTVKNLMKSPIIRELETERNKAYVFGDIINTKKEYETAVEVASGGSLSDIITSDDLTARKLIGYLKKNNLGRATFLPLNILKSRQIENTAGFKNIDGYLGICSDLVEYDSKFENAVRYVLGRTLIARNMESALKIARLSNYKTRIVTLGGEVVNIGGSMTGGSLYHKAVSILSRKREIAECEKNISDLSSKTKELNTKIEMNKGNIKNLDNVCMDLRDEIYQENIENTKISEKINAIENDILKFEKNKNDAVSEIELINEEIKKIDIDIASKNEEIAKVNVIIRENANKTDELKNNVSERKILFNKLKEELTLKKIKKAQNDEALSNKSKDIDRTQNEIDESKKKIEYLKADIQELQKSIENSKNSINLNKNKLDDISKRIMEFENGFNKDEIAILKLKEVHNTYNSRYEEVERNFFVEENELHKVEMQNSKIESEKKSALSKLNDEIGMTFAEALQYKTEIDNLEIYKRDINIIKDKISSLGNVNVASIKEYEETTEKYTFLNNQRNDLINAKEELIKVIDEMTLKIKSVFSENFEKLRIYFNETFREIFKGGKADLVLSGDDELTSDIDITVELPGKRLQNINLMSGGEKVLSAIALLFAIFKMKPTPFCILDEIEAALDDANVFRYAEFLKKFSKNVQFIVITHRKGTMEASDTLYGVTMQERGVSKIVSVNLIKDY